MPIAELAARQLAAYNNADLDAFCACYHQDVKVFEGEEQTVEGRAQLRERYADLFAGGAFGADVSERMAVGRHCVDREQWWRLDPESGERSEGELLVRMTELDGLIGVVQFLFD